jgi:hypothetical protein
MVGMAIGIKELDIREMGKKIRYRCIREKMGRVVILSN